MEEINSSLNGENGAPVSKLLQTGDIEKNHYVTTRQELLQEAFLPQEVKVRKRDMPQSLEMIIHKKQTTASAQTSTQSSASSGGGGVSAFGESERNKDIKAEQLYSLFQEIRILEKRGNSRTANEQQGARNGAWRQELKRDYESKHEDLGFQYHDNVNRKARIIYSAFVLLVACILYIVNVLYIILIENSTAQIWLFVCLGMSLLRQGYSGCAFLLSDEHTVKWKDEEIKELKKIRTGLFSYVCILLKFECQIFFNHVQQVLCNALPLIFLAITQELKLYPLIKCRIILQKYAFVLTRDLYLYYLQGDQDLQGVSSKDSTTKISQAQLLKTLSQCVQQFSNSDILALDYLYEKLFRVSVQNSLFFFYVPLISVQITTQKSLPLFALNVLLVLLLMLSLHSDSKRHLQSLQQIIALTEEQTLKTPQAPLSWLVPSARELTVDHSLADLQACAKIGEAQARTIERVSVRFQHSGEHLGDVLYLLSTLLKKLPTLKSLVLDLRQSVPPANTGTKYNGILGQVLREIPFSPLHLALDLDSCELAEGDATALAQSLARFQKLVNLKLLLRDNALAQPATDSVFGALRSLRDLQQLQLDCSGNEAEGGLLAQSLQNMPGLKILQLSLSRCNLARSALDNIAHSLSELPNLACLELDLSGNDLSNTDAAQLARALESAQNLYKIDLDLNATKFTAAQSAQLLEPMSRLKQLSYLALAASRNALHGSIASVISKFLHQSTNVSHLEFALCDAQITEEGARTMATGIMQQKNLYFLRLDLENVGLTDYAAAELLRAIYFQTKRFLTNFSINLKGNKLGNDCTDLRNRILQDELKNNNELGQDLNHSIVFQ